MPTTSLADLREALSRPLTAVRFGSGTTMSITEPPGDALRRAWLDATAGDGPPTLEVTALHIGRAGWPSYRVTVLLSAIESVSGHASADT